MAPSGRGLEQLQPRQEAINRDSAQGLLRTVPCLGVLALSPETPAQSQCQTHPVELFSSSQSLQLLIPPYAPGEAKSSPDITQRPSSEHATPQEQDRTNTTTVQAWCDTVYSSPRFWISINPQQKARELGQQHQSCCSLPLHFSSTPSPPSSAQYCPGLVPTPHSGDFLPLDEFQHYFPTSKGHSHLHPQKC